MSSTVGKQILKDVLCRKADSAFGFTIGLRDFDQQTPLQRSDVPDRGVDAAVVVVERTANDRADFSARALHIPSTEGRPARSPINRSFPQRRFRRNSCCPRNIQTTRACTNVRKASVFPRVPASRWPAATVSPANSAKDFNRCRFVGHIDPPMERAVGIMRPRRRSRSAFTRPGSAISRRAWPSRRR